MCLKYLQYMSHFTASKFVHVHRHVLGNPYAFAVIGIGPSYWGVCQLPVYVTLKRPPAGFFTNKGMLVYICVHVFPCIRGLVCTLVVYASIQYALTGH